MSYTPLDNKNGSQGYLLYPAKLSINIDVETKIFHEKIYRIRLKIPTLQWIIDGKLQHKDGNYIEEKGKN